MNQEAFVVLGRDLIYKKHLVLRVLCVFHWNLSGRYKFEFAKNLIEITDYQWITSRNFHNF